jgi:hypothetical protein
MQIQKIPIIVALVVGLAGGYFLGREHIKHEMRSALKDAVAGLGEGLQEAFGGSHGNRGTSASPAEKYEKKRDGTIVKYIRDSMEAYDVSSSYRNDFVDGRVAVVSGKIKNKGARTLSRVEVTAYFLDGSGNEIFENSFLPVLASGIMADDTPLRPNYIKEFAFKTSGCPSEWQEGRVRLAITDLEFE